MFPGVITSTTAMLLYILTYVAANRIKTSSLLTTETAGFPETSVFIYPTIRRYVKKYINLQQSLEEPQLSLLDSTSFEWVNHKKSCHSALHETWISHEYISDELVLSSVVRLCKCLFLAIYVNVIVMPSLEAVTLFVRACVHISVHDLCNLYIIHACLCM